jgi:hypothetical protein
MWTSENRPKYNRDKLRYPSDLTDDEWSHIEPIRAGSVCLNSRLSAAKWISAMVMLQPGLAAAQ